MCHLEKIDDLSWKYLRMYPLRNINWKEIQDILTHMEYEESRNFQKQIIDSTIDHPLVKKYPPAIAYTQLFLKALISQIEGCGQEVHDNLYTTYTELLSQDNSQWGDFCYKTYKQAKSRSITLKETCKIISDGTTGMCTWQASHFLAEWCCKNTSFFEGKKILELGAGLGMAGLSVIQNCKPSSYTFTDSHNSVLKVLNENVQINLTCEGPLSTLLDEDGISAIKDQENELEIRYYDTDVQIKKLDWESDTYDSDVDIVLAADVVYDTDVITHLIKILKDIISRKPGVSAYIASTVRNPDTYTFFRNELACRGLVAISEAEQQYQESPSQPQLSLNLLKITLQEAEKLLGLTWSY